MCRQILYVTGVNWVSAFFLSSWLFPSGVAMGKKTKNKYIYFYFPLVFNLNAPPDTQPFAFTCVLGWIMFSHNEQVASVTSV